mgnify:CR=1 FL=1
MAIQLTGMLLHVLEKHIVRYLCKRRFLNLPSQSSVAVNIEDRKKLEENPQQYAKLIAGQSRLLK